MKKEKEAFDSGKKVIYQKRQGSGIKRIVNGLGGIIGELKVQAEMRNAKTSRGRKVEISKRLKKQHDENVSDIARATFGMQPKEVDLIAMGSRVNALGEMIQRAEDLISLIETL